MDGYQLSFANDIMNKIYPEDGLTTELPSFFWTSRVIEHFPLNPKLRKKDMQETFLSFAYGLLYE